MVYEKCYEDDETHGLLQQQLNDRASPVGFMYKWVKM